MSKLSSPQRRSLLARLAHAGSVGSPAARGTNQPTHSLLTFLAGAAAWFSQLGQPVPFGVNVADHLLDMASGEISGKAG